MPLFSVPRLLLAAPEPRAAVPEILAYLPTHGPVGTKVILVGRGLKDAGKVTVGGVAGAFRVLENQLMVFTIPAGAQTGSIVVTTPEGSAKAPGIFTVEGKAAAPTLTGFSPAQGPVGTPVTLTGTGFAAGAKVAFNGAAAASVKVVSATRIQAAVPAGATTGPITVTTSGGTATSSGSFTVQGPNPPTPPPPTPPPPTPPPPTPPPPTPPPPTPPPPTPPPPTPPPPSGPSVSIAGWYVNQSVQTLSRSIPLVAGKDGLLRVFLVASAANQASPAVQVTITGGSPSPWVQTLPAPAAGVPTALAEGTLASSWNVKVPGAVLTPQSTLSLQVSGAPTAPGGGSLSAPLDAQVVNPFKTTLIPVTQMTLIGDVTTNGRALSTWTDRLQRMYGLAGGAGAVDVQLGPPYSTQADLNSGSSGWSQLLGELDRKRTAEGTGRYYYGAVNVSYSSGIAGLGYVGGPTAIGWDKTGYSDGGNYPEVLAHEVGHNFGRQHAPCGVTSPDPGWPTDPAHANAHIGVYGWDAASGALVPPTQEDIMSYCNPKWVSDYTYDAVLKFRASNAGGLAQEAAPVRCLMVSGDLRCGKLTLDPAFILTTRPSTPEGEEFYLELQDAAGDQLQRIPFSMSSVADLPGDPVRHFAFAVPVTSATEHALQTLRVLTARGVLAVRRGGWSSPPKTPVARNAGASRVLVQWEAQGDAAAMVRDPRDGQVLAFATGGSAEVVTDAPKVEVDLSNGVTSTAFTVPVKPAE